MLHFVDFNFEVPQSCPTALPFLPDSHHPKLKWVDSGTMEAKSTKPSSQPIVTLLCKCLQIIYDVPPAAIG